MSDDIRIYVACLAAYNNGKLHGVWINALDDVDSIQDQVNTMLTNSPEPIAEDYVIHDYEGFGSYGLSQYESLERVHEFALFIAEYPKFGYALLSCSGGDLDEARRDAQDNYLGCYDSAADYARDVVEQTSDIPEHLINYIDYESIARDMVLGGDIYTLEMVQVGDVHIFAT